MKAVRDILYVAAGGGGDVLGAAMVAATRGPSGARMNIATFAWERKRYDPRPGPRAISDFDALDELADGVWRVSPGSRLRRGRSFLPALAGAIDNCYIYLLDPYRGVAGLQRQLTALLDHINAEELAVVDVGGDILARGGEPGLRSPTADSMALAAAYATGACVAAHAVGLGLDGELTEYEWRSAWRQAVETGASIAEPVQLSETIARKLLPSFKWHPSEVAGLACLSALGVKGVAEIRADGLRVTLSLDSARIHSFEPAWLVRRNRVAWALIESRTLDEVDDYVRKITGRTELDDEQRMLTQARRYRTSRLTDTDLETFEQRLLEYSRAASERGIRFLTLRRIGELLSLSPAPFAQLRRHLSQRHPARLEPPVWRTRG